MVETNNMQSNCIELYATSDEKSLLTQAAAIEHLDLTTLVMRIAVPIARDIVKQAEEHIRLSERDSLLVLELLENPPQPNDKLIRAAKALADNQKKLDELQ
jgi:uncharacterized protein (DUF1778 family)